MKNVVIISSSPRQDGNSETLCKEFLRGVESSGHQGELICLRNYDIKYCTGCYACPRLGRCVIDDGMKEIGEKLLKADVIVLATPVYFYSMSGQLKVFIDRLIPYYRKIKADIYLIATMYDNDKEMMDSTFESIRGATRDCFINCEEKGVIYGLRLWELEDASRREDLKAKAFAMGMSV